MLFVQQQQLYVVLYTLCCLHTLCCYYTFYAVVLLYFCLSVCQAQLIATDISSIQGVVNSMVIIRKPTLKFFLKIWKKIQETRSKMKGFVKKSNSESHLEMSDVCGSGSGDGVTSLETTKEEI